jgi:hypothetical protein
VTRFSAALPQNLCVAVDASVESLKRQLLLAHNKIRDSVVAKAQFEQSLCNNPGKFIIRKMSTGSIDDFHKGLQDRIGE